MTTPKYEIRLRKFEDKNADDQSPWWLWDLRAGYWYIGFDSKTDAIDFCVDMGHSYRKEEDCTPLPALA